MRQRNTDYSKMISIYIFLPLMANLYYIKQINLNMVYIVLAIQCIIVMVEIKRIKISLKGAQGILLGLLYMLFFIAVFSGLLSNFKIHSVKISFLVFIPSILLYILTISDNNPEDTFIRVLQTLLMIGVVFALLAIILFSFGKVASIHGGKTVQMLKLGPLKFYQIVMGTPPNYRVASLTANPNTFGLVLMLSQVATIYMLNIGKLTPRKTFVLYVIQIIGLVLSQSRGGIIASVIMTICFLFLSSPKKLQRIKILTISVVSLLLIYYIIKMNRFTVLSRFHQVGVSNRDVAWKAIMDQIYSNPFIGVGFGVSSETVLRDVGIKAHNVFLNCLSEIGLIGFLTFISIWILGLICSFSKIRRYKGNKNLKNTYILSFSILFGLLFHQLVENKLLVYDFTMLLWIYLISFVTIQLKTTSSKAYYF